MVIPHTSIPISSIRINDIQLLLILGFASEILRRTFLRNVKLPGPETFQDRDDLVQLRIKANKMSSLGPSAFVETSKLERKILGLEKKINDMEDIRQKKVKSVEKVLKRLNIVVNMVVFLVYYGIPLLTIDGLRIPLVNPELVAGLKDSDDLESGVHILHASVFMKGMMFPLSYLGIGMRVSKIGLGDIKHCSTGALVVFWSAQVMAGKIFDCYEALRFR